MDCSECANAAQKDGVLDAISPSSHRFVTEVTSASISKVSHNTMKTIPKGSRTLTGGRKGAWKVHAAMFIQLSALEQNKIRCRG